MSIKAVIFDVDGTLLNTYEDLANAVNYALKQCGFPEHRAEKYKYFAGNGTDMMITRALPEDCRDEQSLKKVREIYFEYYKNMYKDVYYYDYRTILVLAGIYAILILIISFILYRKIRKIEVNDIIRGLSDGNNKDK